MVNVERKLTARGEVRRAALLDAAITVVSESGSGRLTHRTVAATANVSLASVTYHFSSIDDLRRSMFERALQILDDQISTTDLTGRPEELPKLIADYILALVTRHRGAAVAVQEMSVAATHDVALRPTLHAYHDRLADMLAPCVGGRPAGLAVAAAMQGLILSALTYPNPDAKSVHQTVLAMVDGMHSCD